MIMEVGSMLKIGGVKNIGKLNIFQFDGGAFFEETDDQVS